MKLWYNEGNYYKGGQENMDSNNEQKRWTIPLWIAGISSLFLGLWGIIDWVLETIGLKTIGVSKIPSNNVAYFLVGLAFISVAWKLSKRKTKDCKNEPQEHATKIEEEKEVTLTEIKDSIKRSRKYSYGQGIYIAGIVQLSIWVTALFAQFLSIIQFPQKIETFSPLITGAILLFIGAYFMGKAKKDIS